MQQLIETYFMYDWKTDYYSNDLIFSEKHLCNELDFGILSLLKRQLLHQLENNFEVNYETDQIQKVLHKIKYINYKFTK